jgi:hypothetical protein
LNFDGIRALVFICALFLAVIAAIAVLTKRQVDTAKEHQLACERIGGVLVRQDRGGAVCVQRALPPSAKGVKLT